MTNSTITQVTNSPATTGSFNAAINADGTYVAFDSDENLTGGNPDFNREIFLFNIASNTTTQLTNSTGSGENVGNFAPSINANGTRIAFHSNRDLTGAMLMAPALPLYREQTRLGATVTALMSYS